ncbi:MAG: hypothetical protein AAF989_13440 [Planctomycetota bacterium]
MAIRVMEGSIVRAITEAVVSLAVGGTAGGVINAIADAISQFHCGGISATSPSDVCVPAEPSSVSPHEGFPFTGRRNVTIENTFEHLSHAWKISRARGLVPESDGMTG